MRHHPSSSPLPQMHAKARAELVQAKASGLELPSGPFMWVVGPQDLGPPLQFSRAHEQGTEMELEQPGCKLRWAAGIVGSN